jgi:hypothetical protein
VIIATAGFIGDNSTVFTIVAGIITAVFLPAMIQMGVTSTVQAARAVAAWLLLQAQASLSAVRIAASWVIAMGPIGLLIVGVIALVVAIVKNWDTISDATARMARWVADKFMDIVSFIWGLPNRIAQASFGMFDGIKDAFLSALNWIIDRWNRLEFKLPEVDTNIPGIGKVGGFTLGTPDIPKFGEGGLAKGWAIVGDKGPELVHVGSTSRVFPDVQGAGRQEVHYHFEPHGTFEEGYDPQDGFDQMIAMARTRTGSIRVS